MGLIFVVEETHKNFNTTKISACRDGYVEWCYSSTLFVVHRAVVGIIYRIAGNIGEELNLVDWQFNRQINICRCSLSTIVTGDFEYNH